MNINKIIGNNLLSLRKNKKLTQLELAEQFNYSDKTISKWENGESLPSIETLYELASFYGVTLNDLTAENITMPTAENRKTKDKLFPTKLIITVLAVSAVWLLATVVFVCLKIILDINFGFVFVWAVPVSFVVLLIFNSIWGKSQLLFPILTLLIWSTLVSIHLPLAQYNIWIIYILGIPLQVAVILWSFINRKPIKKSKKDKNNNQKGKKENKPSAEIEKNSD